ncbi:hypothetical protein [Amaricoccus sp.]|uniref:hypothetical protein n=1 Tax=Amaricoccus sp. TaxID=1872485 RepID=UPI001B62D628|nr:hypothetical protein [Amaricoccus sp.]MBP7001605.1 hypothetical protein [Amaricoccus sp.]
MIQPTRPEIAAGYGRSPVVARAPGLVAVLVEPARAASRPAPRPAPRRIASGLQAPAGDGVRLHDAGAARAALSAFTAGDGFLPGQLIDRAI